MYLKIKTNKILKTKLNKDTNERHFYFDVIVIKSKVVKMFIQGYCHYNENKMINIHLDDCYLLTEDEYQEVLDLVLSSDIIYKKAQKLKEYK